MKILQNGKALLVLVCVMLGLASCMNDGGSDWVGKWQLREYQYADGTVQKVDSIFYGFQKGSFLAYCMNENGGYEGFYGYYKQIDDEISITLWPDNTQNDHPNLVNSASYKKFFGWGEAGERTFKVEELTNKKMRLDYNGTKYIFRKY
ncbi:MAG: lipocalin-like domain-containing protein [Bacteroides sp.]|nr:lipocalin-like domain-containing protein [Bacteroides sp.]